MLNKIQKLISYIIFGVIILFAFAFLSKQLSLTYHLRETLLHTNNANFNIEDLKNITKLHQASARVFLLAFFSFLVIITGFAIVMNGINKAYDIAEVKEKVRLHLKSTGTGLLMIIAGLFLLAFCSYKHSSIETFYSSRLVNYHRNISLSPKVAQQNAEPLHIDSSMLPHTFKSLSQFDHKSNTRHPEHVLMIAKTNKKHEVQSTLINIKNTINNQTKSSNSIQKSNSKIDNYISIPLAKKNEQNSENIVSEKDVDWAKQLEKNAVVYGYVPHERDVKKYENVSKQKGSELNGDMHWAYTFLEKTAQGYQPNDNELRRYERIIEDNVQQTKQ